MTLWLTLILLITIGFSAYVIIISKRINTFRAMVEINDYCVFFIDEDRCIGKVVDIDRSPEGTQITIMTGALNKYIRDISEIYPV